MAEDTDASRALQLIREKISALNFATDAILALLETGALTGKEHLVELWLRRLSARRTDLRDERMAIILAQQVTNPPSDGELAALRTKVQALYNYNVTAAAAANLVSEAIAIAQS